MIELDRTLLIQLFAFVVFWQIMKHLLFIPAQRALQTRTERTAGVRARADKMVAEAAGIDATVQTGLAEAKKDGVQRADEIRRRAEAEEHAIVERYRAEAATLLERERALTGSQVEQARAPLETEASRLAENVVRRVLGRAA